jgi:acyl carrier protein
MHADRLIGFIRGELGYDAPLDADTSLFRSGLIDSFALVSLIAFVESECGFDVRPGEVTMANWDTVRSILAYVDTRMAPGPS